MHSILLKKFLVKAGLVVPTVVDLALVLHRVAALGEDHVVGAVPRRHRREPQDPHLGVRTGGQTNKMYFWKVSQGEDTQKNIFYVVELLRSGYSPSTPQGLFFSFMKKVGFW